MTLRAKPTTPFDVACDELNQALEAAETAFAQRFSLTHEATLCGHDLLFNVKESKIYMDGRPTGALGLDGRMALAELLPKFYQSCSSDEDDRAQKIRAVAQFLQKFLKRPE